LLSAARASFGAAMGKGIDGRRLWATSSALGGALSLGAAGDKVDFARPVIAAAENGRR